MTRNRSSAAITAIALALISTGCGDEVESAPAEESAAATAADAAPWERIPPDSLYGATAVENIEATRVILDVAGLPPEWDGMRIAAISDFQLGLWEENEAVATAAVRRALAEGPDLVALLGDYIAMGSDTAALGRVVAPLRGRNAIAVLGDRDVRNDSLAAAISAVLRANGVTVLRNAVAPITRNGVTAGVVGLDPELVDDPWATQEYVLAVTGGGMATPLLLAHHPALVARAPERKYSAALAGNTLCGPVEVSGTPRLSWLAGEAIPGAVVPGTDRLFMFDVTVMFVTCGVGYSFIPTRLGGAPEVALITLEAVERDTEAPEAADSVTAADSLLQSYTGADTTG